MRLIVDECVSLTRTTRESRLAHTHTHTRTYTQEVERESNKIWNLPKRWLRRKRTSLSSNAPCNVLKVIHIMKNCDSTCASGCGCQCHMTNLGQGVVGMASAGSVYRIRSASLYSGSDLFAACGEGRLDVVKRILQKKPSLLDYRDRLYKETPLHHACRYVLTVYYLWF